MSNIQEYIRDREDSNISKITIDHDLCLGCGSCVNASDSTYELNNENKSIVTDANALDDETLIQSAQVCPTLAILFHDKEGNQIPPK